MERQHQSQTIVLDDQVLTCPGETITAEEILNIAGWDAGVELVLDLPEGRDVQPGEEFDLRKSHRFKRRVVLILVNRREVRIRRRVATGLQIKEGAIAQGVPIGIDFVLFRLSGEELRPIKDDEPVKVHDHDEFRCVAADDNSQC